MTQKCPGVLWEHPRLILDNSLSILDNKSPFKENTFEHSQTKVIDIEHENLHGLPLESSFKLRKQTTTSVKKRVRIKDASVKELKNALDMYKQPSNEIEEEEDEGFLRAQKRLLN